jgi:hypothetical protein
VGGALAVRLPSGIQRSPGEEEPDIGSQGRILSFVGYHCKGYKIRDKLFPLRSLMCLSTCVYIVYSHKLLKDCNMWEMQHEVTLWCKPMDLDGGHFDAVTQKMCQLLLACRLFLISRRSTL